jgi:excisionase family DNA binding protein
MYEVNAAHDAEPILVSPRQALRLLDISNSSLYGLLRSGQLRSLHVGRSRRIPLEAIKEFVAKRLAANSATPQKPRRGRPKGSRNKPKSAPLPTTLAAVTEQRVESA